MATVGGVPFYLVLFESLVILLVYLMIMNGVTQTSQFR